MMLYMGNVIEKLIEVIHVILFVVKLFFIIFEVKDAVKSFDIYCADIYCFIFYSSFNKN